MSCVHKELLILSNIKTNKTVFENGQKIWQAYYERRQAEHINIWKDAQYE